MALLNETIVIWGSSGHAKVLASLANAAGYRVVGFIEENPKESKYLGLPIGSLENWEHVSHFVVGIGNPKWRKLKHQQLKRAGKSLTTLIHPSAVVEKSASVGKGSVVLAGAIVGAGAHVGEGCILNHASTVDHDCIVQDFAHICPGVNLAGDILIGEGAWIGIGSSIIQGLKIGAWTTVGAGSVVIRSLEANKTYAGVPAKLIRSAEYYGAPAGEAVRSDWGPGLETET